MPTLAITEPLTVEAERLWREIAGQVREACILRRQGRHLAATEILEHTLPPLIRSWAGESALPAAEAKARLNQLFTEEQARVESHWLMARFLNDDRAAATAARQLNTFPAVPVSSVPSAMWFPSIAPRRIPLDAVVDMIDAARDLERSAAQLAHSPSL
jgi:hypothetical protein